MINKIRYYNFTYYAYQTKYGCEYYINENERIYYYLDDYIGGMFNGHIHNENLYLFLNFHITQYVDTFRDILPYLEELCNDENNIENLRLAFYTITNYGNK